MNHDATLPARTGTPVTGHQDLSTVPESGDEVLQLAIVTDDDSRARIWVATVIDIASRNDGFLGARTLRSADGSRVIVGLRWNHVEAMAHAALSSAALRHLDDDCGDETIVFFETSADDPTRPLAVDPTR